MADAGACLQGENIDGDVGLLSGSAVNDAAAGTERKRPDVVGRAIWLLIVMFPVLEIRPIRRMSVKMRSSSASESSSTLAPPSVGEPRSTAQAVLTGWIVTLSWAV